MTFADVMERVAQAFEIIGAAVLLIGLLVSALLGVRVLRGTKDGRRAYLVLRQSFGGVILLGLEILVAADLVKTVTSTPSLTDAFVLGIIVLIRTILSFSLQVEIDGDLPWRRALTSGAVHIARAARDPRRAAQASCPPQAPEAEGV